MSTTPLSFDGKTPPPMLTIFSDNDAEVLRLCSGEYLSNLGRPDGLQPVWAGILYCARKCASASRADEIANGMSDPKTLEALRGLAATERSNALYRLRAVAKFLSDASSFAAKLPPTAVAQPMQSFFAAFSERLNQVAHALVMRRSGKSTVGVVHWDFPLPKVQSRTISRPVSWPDATVAPAIYSAQWRVQYPVENLANYPTFDSDKFLNAGYEQLLNMASFIRRGKAKGFQDASLKKTRVETWDFLGWQASVTKFHYKVDARLSLSLFYCFSYSWFEAGFGPEPSGKITKRLDSPPYTSEMRKLAGGMGDDSDDSLPRVPWPTFVAVSALVAGAIFLAARRSRS